MPTRPPWWPLLADTKVQKFADGMQLVKSILVKGKLVNLILKPKV